MPAEKGQTMGLKSFTLAFAVIASATVMSAGAASAANLITNGDFSSGNTGFTTQYSYVSPTPNALYPEGDITIAANPISVHNLWVDLGDTTNPMLIVNGATRGSPTIWEEDGITTSHGGTYTFGASVMDICCNASFGSNSNSPSLITFQVSTNGGGSWADLGSYMTTPGLIAQSGDSGLLESINGSFVSTAGGQFSIRALSGINAPGGNDFALDNISVTGVPEPTTWAMMLMGLAGLGVVLRADRRKGAGVAVA
jgi:hypothetical protein